MEAAIFEATVSSVKFQLPCEPVCSSIGSCVPHCGNTSRYDWRLHEKTDLDQLTKLMHSPTIRNPLRGLLPDWVHWGMLQPRCYDSLRKDFMVFTR